MEKQYSNKIIQQMIADRLSFSQMREVAKELKLRLDKVMKVNRYKSK